MTEDHSKTDDRERTSRAEAERYAEAAIERPDSVRGEQSRIVALLRADASGEPIEETLERREAASTALARSAYDDADAIRDHVNALLDELRAERTREIPPGKGRSRAVSREIEDALVRTIALVIAERPGTVARIDDVPGYVDAITTGLDTGTLRIAARALFAGASELQHPGPAVETLGELIAYPDGAVQAWSAGALGRLSEEHPDAVAPIADDLRGLLDREDETIRHNAVEALGALVQERPDVVAPAADDLRDLLGHEEAAIQHNAAGVLGRLAGTHPDAVIPAVDSLDRLRDHEDEAVRRIAAGALARLARERPEAVPDG